MADKGAGGGGDGGGGAKGFKRPRAIINAIGNKLKRAEVLMRHRLEAKKDKKQRRDERRMVATEMGSRAPPKEVPRTTDNTREVEETVVLPDDEEVFGDEAEDEFSKYFRGEVAPKIMLTTQRSPSGKIYRMIAEFMAILPNSFFYKRRKFRLKKICDWAAEAGFTHILVLSERYKVVNSLVIIHLPRGPSACFKMTSAFLSSEIAGHGNVTGHIPEVLLNGFVTRLGRRVGRLFASLFPQKAEHEGRRACTFHNQRDFVFFRQHRYIFEDEGKKVRLQELGPRFTLRLKWLMSGPYDTSFAEYEWFLKRHEMETSRRRFLL